MTEYEQLSAAIESRIASDPQLRALRKKIAQGTATLAESSKYSQLCAQIMGQKLSGQVLGLSDREGVCTQLLHDRYSDVNQVCEQVMRSIDERAGIAMNPRHAAFPVERVQQLAHSLTDPTVPDETIQRRANTGAANVAISFHDDFVDENAAFRSDAGYECYITRVVGGASCPWCSAMAGRFRYDWEEMPEDIFRRHDNCTCTVTFEQGAFRQDVWSKRSWEAPKTGAGAPPPKVFSKEEADRLEQEHLAQIRGLRFNSSSIDIPGENGIIESERHTPATQKDIQEFEKALKELGFENVTGFENYTESKEHLLEIAEDFSRLKVDFPDYFKGLTLDFGTVKEMTDNDYAGYVPNTGTIHLNPFFYNNFEKMQKVYSSDVSKKYHPVGTDYRATIFHEFGHRVEHIASINPKKLVKSQFEKANGRYYTKKQADEWISNGLSMYATEFDYRDFIAESFAEYYNSLEPRGLCIAVIDNLLK